MTEREEILLGHGSGGKLTAQLIERIFLPAFADPAVSTLEQFVPDFGDTLFRQGMIEVTGLDRPGLLYELTATISKLSLNIASAHVATFGERVVDVFYVTDLLGAQITSPSRQAAIKRALLPLFAEEERKAKAG